ncbi:hypothetical protein J1N35_036821 [Gossypium stocksii]|uniref:RNase H type-1 domain-containing protein n=1 Tax=Gossypium stocksii TaxID=47602 RepID=A0A9D3ZL54_9ROSI|nr:hypothetical protein J1N35_036821 [Gossypium stocksii]
MEVPVEKGVLDSGNHSVVSFKDSSSFVVVKFFEIKNDDSNKLLEAENGIFVGKGFQFFHRVEAVGFLGAIWIGWKDSVWVEVVHNHPQFILVTVFDTSQYYPFINVFVYSSLDRQKRRMLWEGFCEWVKEVFAGKSIEPELNNTLLVLIPKVLVPRRRNITDNILIAQKVIHSIRSKHKNRNWMTVKIDLEKAYDRVRWVFIGASLQAADVPYPQQILVLKDILERFCRRKELSQAPASWISLCIDGAAQITLENATARGTIRSGGQSHSGFSPISLNSAHIRRIHNLMVNIRSWVIQHLPREYNKTADCLAKMALETSQGLRIFEEIPKEVLAFFSIAHSSDSLT